jgi:hypothetical protein
MASKSKRAKMAPKENLQRKFLLWAFAVFLIKLAIIFRIQGMNAGSGDRVYFVDGAWLGADGENYLKGYFALLNEGIFSPESILNYWPAGYPIVILFLSLFGKSWVLTSLSIIQSALFSFAIYFFALQISKTRLKKYSFITFIFIIFNPTLSLSSIAVGYESLIATGLLIVAALIVKDFLEKDNKNFFYQLILSSLIFGLMSFMQPRLIVTGILINLLWVIYRKGIKVGTIFITLSLILTLIFPATLIYRNHKATGAISISTNLGVTMAIGSGYGATGGYKKRTQDVPCETMGTAVQKDNQLVKCILKWYIVNPKETIRLFWNKTIFFWSPWTGPLGNGTMARNPWVNFSPAISIASTSNEGYNFVIGNFGKFISWIWLLMGLALLFYGYLILWQQHNLERFIANMAAIAISTNWLISLMTIGDHRFRIPIMGLSLFLQAIGLKTLLRGGKPVMVDVPTLR